VGKGVRDLEGTVLDLVSQVPNGRVTTFKDVAEALGDPVAARAVGTILAGPDVPEECPRHRVVLADGRVAGTINAARAGGRLLAKEKVEVKGGRVVDLDALRFTEFKSNAPLRRLRQEQERLAGKRHPGPLPRQVDRLVGVDVAYGSDDVAYAAAVQVDVANFEVVRERGVRLDVDFPYIPTYLGYRELPAVEAVLDGWDLEGALLLIDGHGTIHPRRFGIACQAGMALRAPSIGVAKRLLWGSYDRALLKAEGVARVLGDGEPVGWAIAPPSGGPVFASPGNMVTQDEALELTRRSMGRRQPVPLELAHQAAEAMKEAVAASGGG
jgi:deoxyribonuclease V